MHHSHSTTQAKRFLNLGCGSTFHPDWVNIDFHDHGGTVLGYDLRLGIPCADSSMDVVYHSHVLEHFDRKDGRFFLEECFRVLRPGGMIRIAIPDLEGIVRAYLASLEEASSNQPGGKERHEWMGIELLDQLVRQKSGGEMAEYWQQATVPEEAFILSRVGQEYTATRASLKARPVPPQENTALPSLDMAFFQQGEQHRWMYDRVSLGAILSAIGFVDVTRQQFDTSLREDILLYGLDEDMNGAIRKPDSLFIEARKPVALTVNTPKVALFSTTESGGAGIAALRLHTSLRSIGTASHMFVANQKMRHSGLHVLPLHGQRVIPSGNGTAAALELLGNSIHDESVKVGAYKNRPSGLEMFSTAEQCADLCNFPFLKDFDLVHLHWVAEFLNPDSLQCMKGRPVVWTLHDMRPFTGGCHYAGECRKYRQNCGACPQLGSTDERDMSFQIWQKAMTIYRELDLHVVAPSQWLADEAKQSSLFSRFPVHVIKYTHELEIFRPLNKKLLRENTGISPNETVLMFSAQNLGNARKGTKYLIDCMEKLARTPLKDSLHILLLGNNPLEKFFNLGLKTSAFGHINNPEQMAAAYTIADAVLVPSLEDNSPNVVSEAAGCGTPVIAFAAGGIPEMIRHEKTGWLTPVGYVDGLVQGVFWLEKIKHDPTLALQCRAWALESWNAPQNAAEYAALYDAIGKKNTRTTVKAAPARKSSLPARVPSLLVPGCEAELIAEMETRHIVSAYKAMFSIDVSRYMRGLPFMGMYQCMNSGLLQYHPLPMGEADFYGQLQQFDWYYLKDKAEYGIAAQHISVTDAVLEIGCGEGFFTTNRTFGEYTGLEFNPQAIAVAQSKGLNVLADPIHDHALHHGQAYDVVCAFQVLEHIPDLHEFITDCLHCLKPGGRLIFSTPSENGFGAKAVNNVRNMPPHHATRWSDRTLASIKNVFALRSCEILHCPLEDMQVNYYIATIAESAICERMGIPPLLMSVEDMVKVRNLSVPYKECVAKHMMKTRGSIYGPDVVGVFRK